jgi:hypothetical protein
MRRLSAALLSGLLLLGLTNAARAADTLGRLFFTPQQRQDLDRRRQANVQESAATVNSSLTVNGQVSRSGGKNTVWINGVPQENARRPSDPTRVVLPAGEGDSSSVNVKIGQTLDKARGRIKDPIEGGQIITPSERRAPKP